MTNGRINNKDLLAARVNGKVVREIAMKDSSGNVSRWRPDIVEYKSQRYPKLTTNFNDRPNGNLADGSTFIHHQITSVYNRILNGDLVGPTSDYAMDIINRRLTSFSTYFRAKIKSPVGTPANTRLQLRGGNRSINSGPTYQWFSEKFAFDDNRLAYHGVIFNQSWSQVPSGPNRYATVIEEYRENDEIMVLLQGRSVYAYLNGRPLTPWSLTDEQWCPGQFPSILMDPNHIVSEIEVGNYAFDSWVFRGDNFKAQSLSTLWNSARATTQIVGEALQVTPTAHTANGTYFGYNYSKHAIGDTDQIIRAVLKSPSGASLSNTASIALIGRAGAAGATESALQIAFFLTITGGAQIATIANGVVTNRKTATASDVGTVALNSDIELQCIGNRYIGLVDGNCVIDWTDTSNLVTVSKERSYYGTFVSMVRTSASAFVLSPAIDSIQGLTFGDSYFESIPSSIQAVLPATLSLNGGEVNLLGSGLLDTEAVLEVGGTPGSRSTPVFSDNIASFMFPPKPEGTYGLRWSSKDGEVLLANAIQYVNSLARGKYDPTTTLMAQINQWYKIPLNPETTFVSATSSGTVVGMTKGFYRFRHRFTVSYYRNYLQSRLGLPSGQTPPVVAGPVSPGSVDNQTLFSVGNNGSVDLFYMTTYEARTIDNTFDFEIELISESLLPAWVQKSGNQVIPATANTYFKIENWVAGIDYAGTTEVINSEIVVPETGQYTIVWQATFVTANNSNVVRVTNQNGTVIVTKTTPQTAGSSVVTLTKGDRLKMEVMSPNVGDTNRRTVNTTTTMSIVPVI